MKIEQWLGEDNTLGIDIWNKKYRHGEEDFEGWLKRVTNGDEEVAQLIREKKFLYGGRILANRGLNKEGKRVTYSNCFVLTPPGDSIESIFNAASKMARTFACGGGVGVDISKLAPRGAKINNTADETSGAVSFTDLYSMVTGLIGQHGRRGALMISMSCEHPDLDEFINAKTDVNRITKANMSVRMTDEFMRAVNEGRTFHQHFERPETGWSVSQEVNAREVFKRLCDANYDYGEPGCLFWDKVERWNLLSEYDDFMFSGVNPCVRGDTLILTSEGYIPINEVAGQPTRAWNGYEWSDVTPKITGYDQPMLKVVFSDGCEVECTDYHKFVLENGTRVKANELRVGDKLIKNKFPLIEGGVDVGESKAYTNGFFSGDGCVNHVEEGRVRYIIELYGVKKELGPHFCYNTLTKDLAGLKDYVYLRHNDGMSPDKSFVKDFVPSVEYGVKSRLAWLAGLVDSDGTLNSPDGSIAITSVDKRFLIKVKLMLNTLGCTGKVGLGHEGGARMMPTHNEKGEYKKYVCKDSYRLVINASNVARLMALGLHTYRVELIANPNRDASRFVTVSSVERVADADVVYCMNEPKNHTFIANGVIVGNCAEEPLPAGGSCLLGSLNLSEFVIRNNWDGTYIFDYPSFTRAVRTAVRALNDVLDEGMSLLPLAEQRGCVSKWRQIGLGVMGLADLLIKLELRYGDRRSLDLCNDIGRAMIDTAISESALIARDRGAFDAYDYDKTSASEFYRRNTSDETREQVRFYGMRNSQLLTIAPTGTLSTMLGISGGMEPIFATHFDRTTKSIDTNGDKTYKVYPTIVWKYIQSHGLEDDSNLPDFFVTAQNLEFRDRVMMQATWQKHIDASISSTVNLPEDFPRDKVYDIYMMAWKVGCKGITVFRDGCKRDSILTTKEKDKLEKQMEVHKESLTRLAMNPEPREEALTGLQRTLVTGCGNLHVLTYYNEDGRLREVYLAKGSKGGCAAQQAALSRMISVACKNDVSMNVILDQLKSCGNCPSYIVATATKHNTSPGSSCPTAVANALIEMQKEVDGDMKLGKRVGEPVADVDEKNINAPPSKTEKKVINPCPICGAELSFVGGCNSCMNCGWSKCS